MSAIIGTIQTASASRLKAIILNGLPLLVIAALLIYFMLKIYPTGDDGLYELSKLQGLTTSNMALSDRSLTSLIYQFIEIAGGESKFGIVFIHTILWFIFAVETWCLCRLICPAHSRTAIVAALLTFSPVIIKSNIVAITYDSATIVPIIIAYSAILLIVWNLRQGTSKTIYLAIGLLICFFSGLISEYGFCASLAGSFFLIFTGLFKVFSNYRQTLLTGTTMLGISILSYVCFTSFFAVLDVESKKNVFESLKNGQLEIFSPAVSWLSHVIFLNFGSVLRELGNLYYEADSRSSLAALAVGGIIGFLVYLCSYDKPLKFDDPQINNQDKSNFSFMQSAEAQRERERDWKLYLSILGASALTILPFMLTGRNAFEHELNTRYYLPAIPFAVIGMLLLLSIIMSARAFQVFLLLLAFLSGSVTVTYMNKILRHEQQLSALSPQIQTLAGDEGITVFVLADEENSAISLSGKIIASWSDELREKTWVIPEIEAFETYGARKTCVSPATIDLNHRGLLRRGNLKNIYYVDSFPPGEAALIEPYCKN